MHRHVQLDPYENDEVILYMDEFTGTNVCLKPSKKDEKEKKEEKNDILSPRTEPAGALNYHSPKLNRSSELRETDNNPARNAPPSFGPEIDDLEPGDNKRRDGDGNEANDRGIDSGLLPENPRFPGPSIGRYPFDVNIYQQKKTLAQGMMDLALISANANQFRYVLQSKNQPYYMASLAMIGTSLLLQIGVGIGLIWNSTYNVKKHTQVQQANKANNWTVIGIFLVTILNVFISSFGVAEPSAVIIAPYRSCETNISEVDALNES